MTLDLQRMLELNIRAAIAEKYNGTLPVRLTWERNPVMAGWYNVKVEVPGQERVVPITATQLSKSLTSLGYDEIRDEIMFAIFLLLDEDAEES